MQCSYKHTLVLNRIYTMPRCVQIRILRWKKKYTTSIVSLFLLTFVFGYIQYVSIREGAARRIYQHLQQYYEVCENQTSTLTQKSQKVCPCLPEKNWIVSEDDFNSHNIRYNRLNTNITSVKNGSWKPLECEARQHVAVIIPAKNRDQHLQILLQHLHPFLQSQLVQYSIIVVEQTTPSLYNKAASMNAAYIELQKAVSKLSRPLDCVIFHDVDQIPMDNRNMYSCFYSPLHLGGYRSTESRERGYYVDSFGGITSLSVKHFETVNGYSNNFWGWGGEDANLGNRVAKLDKKISVYPADVAQTYWLRHEKDSVNPINYNRQWESAIYFEDGLTNIKYRLAKTEVRPLYTKLYIDLDPLIKDQSCRLRPHSNATSDINCISAENISSGKKFCCYHSEGGPFCCGKSLYHQWKFTILRSFEVHPYRWAAVVTAIVILLILIRVCLYCSMDSTTKYHLVDRH